MTERAASLTVVTDVNSRVDEGMAVTARSLLAAARGLGLGVQLLSPPEDAAELPRRVYVAQAAWKLRRVSPQCVVLYIPRGGLTLASVAKGEVLSRVARRQIYQLILQADVSGVARVSGRVMYLVLSESVAHLIRERGGSARVLRLGVDDGRFRPGGPMDASMWPKSGRARILHVGHLKRGRNVGALAELSRRGYSCLLIASPSTPPDPALWRELESAGVAVVRRHIDDLPAVYRAADVYLFPVTDPRACTTMPLSVLEALSCGTQVVASAFGAIAEAFTDVPAVRLTSEEGLLAEVERAVAFPAPVVDRIVPSWEATVREIIQSASAGPAPKLVLLLGLDGTGKSTQSRLLVAEARERGLRAESVWARWDPLLLSPLLRLRRLAGGVPGDVGGQAYLSRKRRLFRSRLAREAWRQAAGADHFLRVGLTLRRALRSNDIVVCDRYYQDALIDMAVSFGSDPPAPVGLHRFFPEAGLTVLLDADEETLVTRKSDAPSLGYLTARRPLYLEMARRNGWPVIDATQSITDVHDALSGRVWIQR